VAQRGPAERLFNRPLQSRIATITIMLIVISSTIGESSDIVGGTRRAADSAQEV
jgi:hypothetical protein